MGRLAAILERRNFLDLAQSVEDAPYEGARCYVSRDDDRIRTNLTPVTVRHCAAEASIIDEHPDTRRRSHYRWPRWGMEMVRRLGVDGKSSRLPAYIWMIIFG